MKILNRNGAYQQIHQKDAEVSKKKKIADSNTTEQSINVGGKNGIEEEKKTKTNCENIQSSIVKANPQYNRVASLLPKLPAISCEKEKSISLKDKIGRAHV